MLAPSATPRNALTKLNTAIRDIAKRPDTIESFHKLGYEPMALNIEETTTMLRAERDRWRPVMAAGNVKPQ